VTVLIIRSLAASNLELATPCWCLHASGGSGLQARLGQTPPAPLALAWCRPPCCSPPALGTTTALAHGWPRPACLWPNRLDDTARSAWIVAGGWRGGRPRSWAGDSAGRGQLGSGLRFLCCQLRALALQWLMLQIRGASAWPHPTACPSGSELGGGGFADGRPADGRPAARPFWL